jgi:hypothetical protein
VLADPVGAQSSLSEHLSLGHIFLYFLSTFGMIFSARSHFLLCRYRKVTVCSSCSAPISSSCVCFTEFPLVLELRPREDLSSWALPGKSSHLNVSGHSDFVIVDPFNSTNNVARGCFRFGAVQSLFSSLFSQLVQLAKSQIPRRFHSDHRLFHPFLQHSSVIDSNSVPISVHHTHVVSSAAANVTASNHTQTPSDTTVVDASDGPILQQKQQHQNSVNKHAAQQDKLPVAPQQLSPQTSAQHTQYSQQQHMPYPYFLSQSHSMFYVPPPIPLLHPSSGPSHPWRPHMPPFPSANRSSGFFQIFLFHFFF